jgi:diguanylate cyclase (GGDEF)-like protein/PAS domain S-box-containing protein
MLVAHADGRIIEANEAFLRMTGYDRADVLAGRVYWSEMTPPEYADADAAVVRDLLERGACQPYEKEFLRKDGSRVPILLAPYAFDRSTGLGPAFVLDLSDRRRAEQALTAANAALRASDARLRQMFESNAVGMAVCHIEGAIVEANPSFLKLTGYTPEDLAAGRINWPSLTPPEYAPLDHAARNTLLARGVCEPYEKEYVRKNGTRVPVLIAGFAYDPATGNCPTFVLDLSDRRRAEEAERAALRQLRMALETAQMAVWEWNPVTDVSTVSGDMTETYGVPAPPANELMRYVHPDDHDAVTSTVRRALADGGPCEVEFRAVRPDGKTRWVRDVCRRRLTADGRPTLAGVSVDVTDRKEAELALVHDSLHDGLTGLPNRVLFLDRLDHALQRGHRPGSGPFAAIYVDLDRFKQVNDSLGHLAGDELLIKFAELLRRVIRPGDTAARLGGDEFAILLEDVRSEADALTVARRIQTELEQPIQIDGAAVYTSASIGIAMGRPDYASAAEVLRHADAALYRAKRDGRGRLQVFERSPA